MAEYISEYFKFIHPFVKERIIRCHECEHDGTHWNLSTSHEHGYREMDCIGCDPMGFCAWAKPKH